MHAVVDGQNIHPEQPDAQSDTHVHIHLLLQDTLYYYFCIIITIINVIIIVIIINIIVIICYETPCIILISPPTKPFCTESLSGGTPGCQYCSQGS